MRSAAELRILREGTREFIGVNPSRITLTPCRQERTASGGLKLVEDTPRAAQTFRLIDISMDSHTQKPNQSTVDGVNRSVQYILLGEHDSDTRLHDRWRDGASLLEVTEVFPANGYEVRAAVVKYRV